MSESKARQRREAIERDAANYEQALRSELGNDEVDSALINIASGDDQHPRQPMSPEAPSLRATPSAGRSLDRVIGAVLGSASFGTGPRPESGPDLRWRGNQKQQYKAAEARARKRGHYTSTSHIDYGPIGTVDRFVLRCSCGEKSVHRTEAHRIQAEREHMLEEGKR